MNFIFIFICLTHCIPGIILKKKEVCKDHYCEVCYDVIHFDKKGNNYSDLVQYGCKKLFELKNCCSLYLNGQGPFISRGAPITISQLEKLFSRVELIKIPAYNSSDTPVEEINIPENGNYKMGFHLRNAILGFFLGVIIFLMKIFCKI
ncbi:unnamed protein product [Oikopleura dioica]|uniref:Uncharacterized protein n=1 Tax=Oikopleura dioica TaxID=34765 RepID=E4YLU6_OIKDI|nr:unnamed protein product [Oikopleura dioica]